jgi:hypothetical protein
LFAGLTKRVDLVVSRLEFGSGRCATVEAARCSLGPPTDLPTIIA